jgi:uncharacterized protein YdcH (DUF465 family)
MSNNQDVFDIRADNLDVREIVSQIKQKVSENISKGVYEDARIARAEQTNLVNMEQNEDFLRFYLQCLKNAVFVDINDFDIPRHNQLFGWFPVLVKTIIWKMLKFYTYRLFSQQNQVNGLMLSAIQGIQEKYDREISDLKKRVDELENKE